VADRRMARRTRAAHRLLDLQPAQCPASSS
jgi:hypothetical protein